MAIALPSGSNPSPNDAPITPSKDQSESTPMLKDDGIRCLALIAQFHQIAVDPAQLMHRFGSADGSICTPEEIIRASQSGQS